MKQQILIVEDDRLLNRTLAYNLSLEGFTITSATNAKAAAAYLQTTAYDFILLDINLPDGSGYILCQQITAKYPDTVVIFLTANDQEADMIKGYEAGGVDYITKPFSITALLRKISALSQKLKNRQPCRDIYNDGHLFLDFSAQNARLGGAPLSLSSMEYKMLRLFSQNPKQVLTRQLLLEKLWDNRENYVDEHTLTTFVSRLRSKIEKNGGSYIKTIYGMGYLWIGGEPQ